MIREPGKKLSDAEMASLPVSRSGVSRVSLCREFWAGANSGACPFSSRRTRSIPAPDSETLVETALGLMGGGKSPLLLDLGTGTGCLLIALLHERAGCAGTSGSISRRKRSKSRGEMPRNWASPRVRRFDTGAGRKTSACVSIS